MLDPDPYGNLGAIAVASWDSRWMSWSAIDKEAHLASVAHWGPLDFSQMASLIQGLLPPTYEWISPPTCLVEFAPLVNRLKQDIQRGVLANAPTPDEFAAWCGFRHVSLPEAFVREIKAMAALPPIVHFPQQSTVKIIGPAWLPVPDATTGPVSPPPRRPPKRGRPATTASTFATVLQDAKEILMAAADSGEKLTIPKVAKQILETRKDLGMTFENLKRRLKGKLPLQQAKATATKHQQIAPTPNSRRNLY